MASNMKAESVRGVIDNLHENCGTVLNQTLAGAGEVALANRYLFVAELDAWATALAGRPEGALFEIAQREYLVSMLSLSQGMYRNAFKGLRLVLELHLQGVLLSADPIGLNEWLRSAKDTIWAAIVDDQNGVFTVRFARAFFPELEGRVGAFVGIARALYRELSECTHGNVPNAIQLPKGISYDADVFQTWCEKADTLIAIVHFALALRYLKELRGEHLKAVEHVLLERLGSISAVRERLGGPV